MYYGNRVQENTATTGTGAVTFSGAVSGYNTFANGFPEKPCLIEYFIVDGTAWEVGLGSLNAAGTQMTRDNLEESSTGSFLNLSGSAVVFSAPSADSAQNNGNGRRGAQINGWAMP